MPAQTMRAIRLHEHGGPEVLTADEVPVPVPGTGEVLVRVHAVGINPPPTGTCATGSATSRRRRGPRSTSR